MKRNRRVCAYSAGGLKGICRTLWIPILLVVAGCLSSGRIQRGLAYQEQGQYIEAYEYFRDLSAQHPGNEELAVYANTARRLAFRQCVGDAEEALSNDDLNGFLDAMKQANDMQPSQRARQVIELVESARSRGKSDAEIRDELKESMGLGPSLGDLSEAVRETAKAVASKVRSGQVDDPVSVLGITISDTGRSNSACEYLENELTAALVSRAVRVVERENLSRIREEIGRSAGAMMDDESVVEVGKTAGAHSMITGRLFRWEKGVRYQLRVIDVETSRVVYQETREFTPDGGFLRMMDSGR